MLVSKCCKAALQVVTNTDCSYYICTDCLKPTDGYASLTLPDDYQGLDYADVLG